MSEFSLAINEDQQQIKDWVHDFAKNVVRPQFGVTMAPDTIQPVEKTGTDN